MSMFDGKNSEPAWQPVA